MENHGSFLFASPAQLMSSIAYDFDLSIPNYGHYFDEFMFPGSGFIPNTFDSSPEELFDAEIVRNPDFKFSLDGASRLHDGVEAKTGKYGSGTKMVKPTKPKRDRLKTLATERKRRGSMKQQLYELRSLVPNITKMDKASIIADAVVYMSNLQDQTKKLVEEIAMIESSSRYDQVLRIPLEDMSVQHEKGGMVLLLIVHQVGEGRFYMKVECNKGDGVASSLYAAIESLPCFNLESFNIYLDSERYVLTLTTNVREYGEEMSASTVRLWVMGALLNQGFEFKMEPISDGWQSLRADNSGLFTL